MGSVIEGKPVLLLLPLWVLISLLWTALAWLFPSRRFLGLGVAAVHMSLTVSAVLVGVCGGAADGGLPAWIIVPGVVSALIRVAVECSGAHGQQQ
ncbi:hypothetical protein GCM10018773_60910 [Streptomyces candidus]|nr:hypothetical protein GCM10018773_60910 [Streptomyces candidus]